MKSRGIRHKLASKSPVPVESYRMSLIPPVVIWDNTCETVQVRKLIRDSVPKFCVGGWSRRYPLPGTYQNSPIPEGKQLFSIKFVVCTNSLGLVSPSYQFCEWWELPSSPPPKTQVPKCQPRANLVSKLCNRISVRSAMWTLLYIM